MAKAWVRREDLYVGDLPPVCVVTGDDADGSVSIRFDSLPEWTWILLFFGVLPFLVATMFATEEVRGEVPVRRVVVERYHRRKRIALALGAAAVTTIVLSVASAVSWLAWMGVVALVAAISLYVVASFGFIDGRPDRTGVWVALTRVHPRFVEALEGTGQTYVSD